MATPQNGQTHLNNLSAIADELFEYVWSSCGVDTQRSNKLRNQAPFSLTSDQHLIHSL